MSAGKHDIDIKRGDSKTVYFRLTEDDGTPINLTGRTITAAIKKSPNDPKVLVSWTVTVSDQGTSPGEFRLDLTPTQTGKLPGAATQPGQPIAEAKHYWDAQMAYSSVVETFVEGFIVLTGGITP